MPTMAENAKRQQALDDIADNIAKFGHHTYVVMAGQNPRFAYTIGLSASLGFELILAGACIYMVDEVGEIIRNVAAKLKPQLDAETLQFEVPTCGSFTLRNVDRSWATMLMLGALDFYQATSISAVQIVPDAIHTTVDIPDLSVPWNSATAPAWRWLNEEWTYPVPSESEAVTNLDALRGARITEAARWENGYWELFAGPGPDVPKNELRIVPLGTLLSADPSLEPILHLPIEGALWRNEDSDWHPW